MTTDYDKAKALLSKSDAPAPMSMIVRVTDALMKGVRRGFEQRDARIAALEGKVEALERRLQTAAGAQPPV